MVIVPVPLSTVHEVEVQTAPGEVLEIVGAVPEFTFFATLIVTSST